MVFNYIDLFHGIGGFALGAYWAGMKFDNHFCSDIEPFTQELYKLRFPDSVQLGDITKIDWHKLKKDYPGEWIISGGFPCQDISVAGKGKGLFDEKGNKTRSGLWYDYQRGISILRPKFAIMENVRALLSRGMSSVVGSLAEIGYSAEYDIISAEEIGAPHKRERVWIIAYANDTTPTRYRQNSGKVLSKSKSKRPHSLRSKIPNAKSKQNTPSDYRREQGEASTKRKGVFRGSYCREVWRTNWTTEPGICRVVNGVSGQLDRLKGLGNAIVPQIAEILFNLIKDKI